MHVQFQWNICVCTYTLCVCMYNICMYVCMYVCIIHLPCFHLLWEPYCDPAAAWASLDSPRCHQQVPVWWMWRNKNLGGTSLWEPSELQDRRPWHTAWINWGAVGCVGVLERSPMFTQIVRCCRRRLHVLCIWWVWWDLACMGNQEGDWAAGCLPTDTVTVTVTITVTVTVTEDLFEPQ